MRGGPQPLGLCGFDDRHKAVEEADFEDLLVNGAVVAEDVGAVDRAVYAPQLGS